MSSGTTGAAVRRPGDRVTWPEPSASGPRVVECAVPLTACDDPEFHYRFGIEVFIAGVEAVAARLSDRAAD